MSGDGYSSKPRYRPWPLVLQEIVVAMLTADYPSELPSVAGCGESDDATAIDEYGNPYLEWWGRSQLMTAEQKQAYIARPHDERGCCGSMVTGCEQRDDSSTN